MESILVSTKKLLGIAEEYEHFDPDIIMHINTAFSVLTQLGVGPKEGFYITSENDLWESFLKDERRLEMVKTYVFLRVKRYFDINGLSAGVIDAMDRQISELEWRILVTAEDTNKEEIQNGDE